MCVRACYCANNVPVTHTAVCTLGGRLQFSTPPRKKAKRAHSSNEFPKVTAREELKQSIAMLQQRIFPLQLKTSKAARIIRRSRDFRHVAHTSSRQCAVLVAPAGACLDCQYLRGAQCPFEVLFCNCQRRRYRKGSSFHRICL